MMDDRTLLEAAAKAAGYPIDSDGEGWFTVKVGFGKCRDWNPLFEDADAFRLQVDVGINLDFRAMRVRAYADEVPGAMEEAYDRDKRAATRRAIVRAAAAIGSAQP
jgi:hypothetical protein